MATNVTVLGAGQPDVGGSFGGRRASFRPFPEPPDRVHAALTPFFLDIVPLPDVFGLRAAGREPSRASTERAAQRPIHPIRICRTTQYPR